MARKLTDADENAIARKLAARRRLSLKSICREYGIDKVTAYRAERRAKKRKQVEMAEIGLGEIV